MPHTNPHVVPTLRTERLLLRDWRDTDLEPFAALNADPEVMRYFPASLSRAEPDALAGRIRAELRQRGWGFWAVQIPGSLAFAGFVGLGVPSFQASFTPCVEIGWRLARGAWGRGHATEAARACSQFALAPPPAGLGLDQIVAFTALVNHRSLRVMDALGMQRDPADEFAHPLLPAKHELSRHALARRRAPG